MVGNSKKENKSIMEEQIHIILSGTDILLSLGEMSVRSLNLVKKIQEAGETLFSQLESEKELEEYLSSHVRRYKGNNLDAICDIEDTEKLGILDSYIKESNKIRGKLEQYYKEDIEMFRIKVHGLKSTSKQIGYMRMGENAEIMEMAAKAGHLNFIEKNLKSFLADIRITLEEAQNQYDELAKKIEIKKVGQNMKLDPTPYSQDETERFLAKLKKAFEEFALDDIEELIRELKQISFPEKKQNIFDEVCRAAEELEYERGSQLIEQIWRG